MSDAPALFAPAGVHSEARDGATVLRSAIALQAASPRVGAWLEHYGTQHPDRPFLVARAPDGSRTSVSYGVALARSQRIGHGLLRRGLGPKRPLMILAHNGIDHALMALGGLWAGVPVAPVSTAYVRLSPDLAGVRSIHDRMAPGLVFVDDAAAMAPAVAALATRTPVVVGRGEPPAGGETMAAVEADAPSAQTLAAAAAVGPDTVAKILWTSGSTGAPKGVVTTHRMLCANQQMLRQVWPFLTREPPILLDWLPWHHTFGGSHNFGLVLQNGGTLWVDDGAPTEAAVGRTIDNLRAVSPTVYFNVPAGFRALLPYLEADEDLARRLFAGLRFSFFAAAALPGDLWDRMIALSTKVAGRPVTWTSAWGMTETAPASTTIHFPADRPDLIGVPLPGVELKLIATGDRHELRVRGPSVFERYLGDPDTTAAAFDDEGYYITGDAARFADPRDPSRGLLFAGRIGEDFKLTTGTWVYVGALRTRLVEACAPWVSDLVIVGPGRDALGVLWWPNVAALKAEGLAVDPQSLPATLRSDAVRDRIAGALAQHNRSHPARTQAIRRALVLAEPPRFDAGEITDKGYVNQRAALAHRADDVERLVAAAPPADVLVID